MQRIWKLQNCERVGRVEVVEYIGRQKQKKWINLNSSFQCATVNYAPRLFPAIRLGWGEEGEIKRLMSDLAI